MSNFNNIICPTHSETVKLCCLDNNCSRKVLCPACLKNSSHYNVFDIQFLIKNLQNYIDASSTEQFDVSFIKSIDGANIQQKVKTFELAASATKLELNKQHVEPMTKKLEDNFKQNKQILEEFTIKTIEGFKGQLKDICDHSLLQNNQIKILSCQQVLNAINVKEPFNVFNQTLEDLHKGKLQLDMAVLQFNYICENFEPILNYFCERTLEYIKKEVKIMENHLQTLKENALKIVSKEDISQERAQIRIRILNSNPQQQQQQPQSQQASHRQRGIEDLNSNRSTQFLNNFQKNQVNLPINRVLHHQKHSSLQYINDSSIQSPQLKQQIMSNSNTIQQLKIQLNQINNDNGFQNPSDQQQRQINYGRKAKNILKSLDYTRIPQATDQLFKRKTVLFIQPPQSTKNLSTTQSNSYENENQEGQSNEYYQPQVKFSDNQQRKSSKNLTFSVSNQSQFSNNNQNNNKNANNETEQMKSNEIISSASTIGLRNSPISSQQLKRPMIINPQIQLEDYSPTLKPKSQVSINDDLHSGTDQDLQNKDNNNNQVNSSINGETTDGQNQQCLLSHPTISENMKKPQINKSPQQQANNKQIITNSILQQLSCIQPAIAQLNHVLVENPHKAAICDIMKISSDFFISCSLDGMIASWTIERTPEVSIRKINEIQAHSQVNCFTPCKTPGLFLTSGVNYNNSQNNQTVNVNLKLWLYQDSQIILELTEMRGLHTEPVKILELIKEKYIDQKKSNIKLYSNLIYFLTFDNAEAKFKVWQLYFNSSRRHFGEVNNLLMIQLPGKAGTSPCHVLKVFVINHTVLALTEQALVKFVIAKNYQSASDLQRKVIMTDKSDDSLVSMCRTNNLIFVVTKSGSVIVFDMDLNKLTQKLLIEIRSMGLSLDQQLMGMSIIKPITVFQTFSFSNDKCAFYVKENNKFLLWIVSSDLKKIVAEVQEFQKNINKFIICHDILVCIEEQKAIRGIPNCQEIFKDYIDM